MTDIASMRAVLKGVDTLFLLNAVAADEVTQALAALDLAREAGIQRIVYFSVFNSALFDDVPHFAGKYLVERVIDAHAIPATVPAASLLHAERPDVSGCAKGWHLPAAHRPRGGHNGRYPRHR